MIEIYLVNQNENLINGHGEDVTVAAFTKKGDACACAKVLDGIMDTFDGTFKKRAGVKVLSIEVYEGLEEHTFTYNRVLVAKKNEQKEFEDMIERNKTRAEAFNKLTEKEIKALGLG